MQMLVTDLTRMAQGFICVAGIDTETHKRVRPVIIGQRLTADLVSARGGAFDVRRIVELGTCEPCGAIPEVADVQFDPVRSRHVRSVIGPAFFDHLKAAALHGLDAFGPELLPMGWNGRAIPEGRGVCSLILTRASSPFDLYISDRGTLRARWEAENLDLSVTDIRLYRDDFQTPDPIKVRWLQRQLGHADETYLCYGLSRPFRRSYDDESRHWLQLNNIHVSSAPDWQLRSPSNRYLT